MSQLSYYRNTQRFSFIYETIGSRIRHWSQTQPNKTAIVVHMGHEKRAILTFGELYDKAVKLAKYYLSLGVKPGDRIAVFVYNSPEWLITTVACSLAGVVAVNLFTYAAENHLDMLLEIGCKILVADVRDSDLGGSLLDYIETMKQKGLSFQVILVGYHKSQHQNHAVFDQVLSSSSTDSIQLPDASDPEEFAAIFQTSGSTGLPKFVPYTHEKLINNLYFLYSNMDLTNEDIFFSDRPLGYIAGYPMSLIIYGCTFVTLNAQRTVRDSLVRQLFKIIKDEGVTSAFLPPYLLYDLEKLKITYPDRTPYFNSIITAGQRLSKKLLQRFQEYAAKPCMGYGTTEMGWVTFSNVDDLPNIDGDLIANPLPGMEMKIINKGGHVVPVNTVGEICVRDVSSAGKYLKLGGELVSCLDGRGWSHTGDLGYMMNDGKNFCIKGRIVEMIKRSTIKIFPASIETVYAKHPAVANVVVVGIPDERLYEEVCVCVTVRTGEELTVAQLEVFGVDNFRPHACPDGKGLMPGHFFIFDTFPRLPSQKIDRRKVAELAEDLAKGKTV